MRRSQADERASGRLPRRPTTKGARHSGHLTQHQAAPVSAQGKLQAILIQAPVDVLACRTAGVEGPRAPFHSSHLNRRMPHSGDQRLNAACTALHSGWQQSGGAAPTGKPKM